METELIAGVRAGDWVAFETLYRAYWPRLVAFDREYGARSKHDALDNDHTLHRPSVRHLQNVRVTRA